LLVAGSFVMPDAGDRQSTTSFRVSATVPSQTQFRKLTASDAENDDDFGDSVAIDGDDAKEAFRTSDR